MSAPHERTVAAISNPNTREILSIGLSDRGSEDAAATVMDGGPWATGAQPATVT
jgi:hypothetical protein